MQAQKWLNFAKIQDLCRQGCVIDKTRKEDHQIMSLECHATGFGLILE